MLPIQDQINAKTTRRNQDMDDIAFEDETLKVTQDSTESTPIKVVKSYSRNDMPTVDLKVQLENTLQSATILTESLKLQIDEISTRESILKDAIVNGRSGLSAVRVTSMGRPPRSYMVRDGSWSLCKGLVQFPSHEQSSNLFSELFYTPRCIGHEMSSQQDPCAFNSLIKYETVPTIRRFEYSEDDFLCLKKTFNTTLERYMSVPRQIINDTCQDGIVRSLEDNVAKCGLRVMTEYTYYPSRSFSTSTSLPLEYCTEPDGACKLIIAWHVSNATVENFEFLENEQDFKKFFITAENNIEHFVCSKTHMALWWYPTVGYSFRFQLAVPQRAQNNILSTISGATWYTEIREYLEMPKQLAKRLTDTKRNTKSKFLHIQNSLFKTLVQERSSNIKRLKKKRCS
ncbi:unnamed protein product [Chilo suppressalis]|uniref:Uncharacterized protein n=1 Tax=Chilo suppressalis TaxID=168631 RepID=A0ABN8B1L3_CHISP|nr:unnamed protein product [Chilo suppressalis]